MIILFKTNNILEAIEQFKIALNLDSNLLEAHYAIGVSYRHQGMFNMATESLEKVIAQKPNFAEAYLNLGYAYRAKTS